MKDSCFTPTTQVLPAPEGEPVPLIRIPSVVSIAAATVGKEAACGGSSTGLLFFAKFTRQIFSVKSQIINSLHFANYLWSLLCTVAHSITTGPVSGVGRRKGTGPASMCFLVPLACLVVFTYSCVWFPVPETRTPMQHAVWQPSGVGPRLAFLSTKEASVITRTGYTRSTPQGLQQS